MFILIEAIRPNQDLRQCLHLVRRDRMDANRGPKFALYRDSYRGVRCTPKYLMDCDFHAYGKFSDRRHSSAEGRLSRRASDLVGLTLQPNRDPYSCKSLWRLGRVMCGCVRVKRTSSTNSEILNLRPLTITPLIFGSPRIWAARSSMHRAKSSGESGQPCLVMFEMCVEILLQSALHCCACF